MAPGPARILVVDDEPMIREVLAQYLRLDGFTVMEAADGAAALAIIEGEIPDLVLLDVMLPEIDGLSILRRVRERGPMPVILLTARSDEVDRVVGLELGADDYVVKPFSPREVVARVKTVLRRAAPVAASAPADLLDFGGLRIDGRSREVWANEELVVLTAKEFDLLSLLARSPRQVFSRAQLLEQVWDSSVDYQDPATVTVHIGRLRSKIEADPNRPRYLVTVWGVGYRFEP